MKANKENYTSYIVAGLVMTLLLVAGLFFYSIRESNRLAKAEQNFTSERVKRGREIYSEQCVSCHGAQGEGGAAPALNNRLSLKSTLDSVYFSVIRSGVPSTQMPAWSIDFGGPLTDEDVRDVVAFIRAWEPNAPEIEQPKFEPDASRGAVLFAGTCEVCHGENGGGTQKAPRINDPQRLQALTDEWYREVIRNGRPAKGMPTWGTVLSPNQVEDLVALISAWRDGAEIQPDFSVTDLFDQALFSLSQDDVASAKLHVDRAMTVAEGAALELLRNAAVQLQSGDSQGAQATLTALKQQWPIGDVASGTALYSTNCAACHGAQGEGGVGTALASSEFIKSMTNAELVEFILTGRPGTAMVGFEGRLTKAQIADILSLIRLWQSQP